MEFDLINTLLIACAIVLGVWGMSDIDLKRVEENSILGALLWAAGLLGVFLIVGGSVYVFVLWALTGPVAY